MTIEDLQNSEVLCWRSSGSCPWNSIQCGLRSALGRPLVLCELEHGCLGQTAVAILQ
jgi:hypothetical protein